MFAAYAGRKKTIALLVLLAAIVCYSRLCLPSAGTDNPATGLPAASQPAHANADPSADKIAPAGNALAMLKDAVKTQAPADAEAAPDNAQSRPTSASAPAGNDESATQPATGPTTAQSSVEGLLGRKPTDSYVAPDANLGIKTRDDGNLSGLMIQMLVYLVIVLALAGGGMVLVRKYLPRFGLGNRVGKNVVVLENTSLGPRKTLHVVQVGRSKLLVASSREDIRFLADVTEALKDDTDASEASQNDTLIGDSADMDELVGERK